MSIQISLKPPNSVKNQIPGMNSGGCSSNLCPLVIPKEPFKPGNNFKSCWICLALAGGGSQSPGSAGVGQIQPKTIPGWKKTALALREKRSQEPAEVINKIPAGWEKLGGSGMEKLCLGFKQIFHCLRKRGGSNQHPGS